MLKSVIRTSGALGAAFLADRAVTFVFLAYAARKLGPEMFGQYILVGAYVMFVRMVFAAGVQPVAIRELVLRREQARAVFEEVLSLRLALSLVAYPVLLALVSVALPGDVYLPLMAIAGSSLVIDATKDAFSVYYLAFNQAGVASRLQIINSLAIAIVGTAALFLDYGVMVLLASGAVVNLLVTVAWNRLFRARHHQYTVRLAPQAWLALLRKVMPFAPVVLAVQFNRLSSVIMLSLVPGPVPRDRLVGQFGPAQQMANMAAGLIFSVRRSLLPPVTDKLRRGEPVHGEFAVALKVAAIFVSFPLLAATSLYAEALLWIAFGSSYVEAAPVLRLLGAAAALWIMASMPEAFILASPQHSTRRLLPGAWVPLLMNVALCIVLIPEYGGVGAAVAILVARAAYLAFILYYSRSVLPLSELRLAPFVGSALILAGTYVCSWLVATGPLPMVASVPLNAVILLAGMAGAGRAELAAAWRIGRRAIAPAR
jgi:O-antigen/teichoic acid export membrane protein